MNNKWEYYFHTLNGGFKLHIEANNDQSLQALYELHSIFFEIKDNRFVYDSEIHYVTMKMKEEVRLYTKIYRKIIPQINQLNSAISKMKCGEGFVLLSKEASSTVEELRISEAVLSSNSLSIPELDNLSDDALSGFKKQINDYRFFSPRTDIRNLIGPPRRQDRKCRFCGKTFANGAKFKKIAHAIPESLGNKNIICAEECDSCNEFFGTTYEKSLVEFFNFFRVIDGVKSKEGFPLVKYQNGYAFHRGGISQVYSENIIQNEDGSESIKLKSNEYYSENYFYKALCKMALSVIDTKELTSLQLTLDWLNDENNSGTDLPLVGSMIKAEFYVREPKITVITRIKENLETPHVMAELKVGYYNFLFILPYSNKDKVKYCTESQLANLFKVFPQFSPDVGWGYKSYVNNTMKKIKLSVDLNFQRGEP